MTNSYIPWTSLFYFATPSRCLGWSIVLDNYWSIKIYRPKMIVRSGAIIHPLILFCFATPWRCLGWSIVLDDHWSIKKIYRTKMIVWSGAIIHPLILFGFMTPWRCLGWSIFFPPRTCEPVVTVVMMRFAICNLLFVIPSLILVLIIFSRRHVVKSIMSRSPSDVTKLMTETKIFFQNQIFRNRNWAFVTFLTQDGYMMFTRLHRHEDKI